jgi:hypothetical protein
MLNTIQVGKGKASPADAVMVAGPLRYGTLSDIPTTEKCFGIAFGIHRNVPPEKAAQLTDNKLLGSLKGSLFRNHGLA